MKKLFVEMTDEEYEKYKMFLSGQAFKELSFEDFLEAKGFAKKIEEKQKDSITMTWFTASKWEKGNSSITIRLEQR